MGVLFLVFLKKANLNNYPKNTIKIFFLNTYIHPHFSVELPQDQASLF